MDISSSVVPKSDQLNAEDFLTGPRTFTVERVTQGSAEQPFDFHMVETPGRAYRPSKTMRRVIINAWGSEADAYAGRQLTLYRDADVTFGRDKVGGIKIAALSHIDKPLSIVLTVTRGKRAAHTVEPLTAPAPAQGEPTAEQVAACVVPGTLRDWWKTSSPDMRKVIEARVSELDNPPTPDPADELPIGGEGA